MKSREYILNWLEQNLAPFRVKHCLSTERLARRLALKHGLDQHQAGIAALCHDCAKYLSDDEFLSIAKAHNMDIDEIITNNLYLLHAPVGAIIARREFDIEDEVILSAISCHAVPSRNMSELDMLINMCDLLEETRKFKDIDKARAAAETSIIQGYKITQITLMRYLLKNEKPIHPNSLYSYNDLLDK